MRRTDALHRRWPLLLWAPVSVALYNGTHATYQLLLGVQDEGAPRVEDRSVVGAIDVDGTNHVVYDAMADPFLRSVFIETVMPDVTAERTELLTGERSNTMIVLDGDRVCKIFRRIEPGPNPEVELTDALARRGFDRILAPTTVWRRGDTDLAVVRNLVKRARPGADLVDESLVELLERRVHPKATRSDFARESARLGATVARLHVALAEAFGAEPADASAMVDWLVGGLARYLPDHDDRDGIEASYRRLAHADDLGMVTRVHGDLHLGQTLWTRRHWKVIDFEGDPIRTVAERRLPSSPMRDIAGLLRSLHYASEQALADQRDPDDPELNVLVEAWQQRATEAFLTGYTSIDAVHPLLPHHRSSRDALLRVFEIEKATMELSDAQRDTPGRVGLPERAVTRLLGDGSHQRW